jgi:hypothetical protein
MESGKTMPIHNTGDEYGNHLVFNISNRFDFQIFFLSNNFFILHRYRRAFEGQGICPASPEKEDQRAAGRPAALTQLALCLRLASILRPKADNAPSTLNDSTRQ